MKPNTLRTNAASSNGKSADSLAGRHHQAFTLMERRPWSQRFGGFTLIELLVVIAIISLLMGLIVLCFQLPRENATQLECCSHLKNLFLALQMYADDNDGRCPNPNVIDKTKVSKQIQVSLKFMEVLQPYVKSEDIFWCPNDREKEAHPGGSYGWRVTCDPKASLAGVRLGLLRQPNRVIIAGELSHGCHKSEMINVLYADGHVDLVTMGEILKSYGTPLEF
ncbi:type II secretion system protein [Planctomycetota bacterium]